MRALVAAAGALLAYLIWKSLSWQVTGDASLYHYIAWLMSEGLVLYRDIFDFNMPGVFLVHRAVLAIGGAGDGAWRLFDLGSLAVILTLLYVYCRPAAGRWGAAAAASLFGLYHLAGGSWMTGQRDFLLCGTLLAAMLSICRFAEGRGGERWLAVGGLALGIGLTIKPFLVLMLLAAAAAAALTAPGPPPRRWRAAAIVLAAGAAPFAAAFVWLAAIGGLEAFFAILLGYTLPFYGRLGGAPLGLWRQVGLAVDGWPIALFIAILGLLGWSAPVAAGGARRRWLTLLGVAYGLAHYALQGKGYLYHLYPLICFLLALAAPALGVAEGDATARDGGARAGRRSWLEAVASLSTRHVTVAIFAATLLALGVGGASGRAAFDPGDAHGERGRMLIEDLSRLVPAGESVQVMDDTFVNGSLALLRLGIRQPTPFITDSPLFADEADPRIRRLRERFVAGVVSGRPAAFVVAKHNMVRHRFDRIEELPGLAEFLEENYRLAERRGRAYMLWLRQDLAAPRPAPRSKAGDPR